MKNGYFRKVIKRQGICELYAISDDRKTMVHAIRSNEPFYDRYGEKKGYTNRGWDAYVGEYDPDTDDIKPGTKKPWIKEFQSHMEIMGRLLYYRRFNKAVKEYNSDITPMSKYEQSVTIYGHGEKRTNEIGALNAIYLANPRNDKDMGFPRIKALIESGKLENPTYYIQFSTCKFKKGKGTVTANLPLILACFYDVEGGRKFVIDRLPEFRSNELLKWFFPVILEEFALYPDVRIFFEPGDEFETKLCRRYEFAPTGNEGEYSVTEDEMYNVE